MVVKHILWAGDSFWSPHIGVVVFFQAPVLSRRIEEAQNELIVFGSIIKTLRMMWLEFIAVF